MGQDGEQNDTRDAQWTQSCFGIEEGQRPMTFEIRKFGDGTQRVGMGRRVEEGGL